MRLVLILAIHLLVTLARLLRPSGVRALVAESLILRHQVVIGNRSRQRAPNLTSIDGSVLGLTSVRRRIFTRSRLTRASCMAAG